MRKYPLWTQEDIEKVTQLRAEGVSVRKIAEQLSRSYKSIEQICFYYKIPSINIRYHRRKK